VFILFICGVNANEISVLARYNQGIGFEYNELDYDGNSLWYSPGGGTGFEAGLYIETFNGLYAYMTGEYRFNLALYSDVDIESSFVFSRGTMSVGTNYHFPYSNYGVSAVIIGAGMNYTEPGKLKIIENNQELGDVFYNPAIGFHVDCKIRFNISGIFYLDPGIRYRNIFIDSRRYEHGHTSSLPGYLNRLNVSGIDLSVTLVIPVFGSKFNE
jgi:hypothetical protein